MVKSKNKTIIVVFLIFLVKDVFAFNVGDRVEYIGSGHKIFLVGTVKKILKSEFGKNILEVEFDGGYVVQSTIEKFKLQTSNSGSISLTEIPNQVGELIKSIQQSVTPQLLECDGSLPGKFYESIEVPNSYSINLIWINKKLNSEQKYISSAQDETELQMELLAQVIKWAIANPTAEVNLWYDGMFVTSAAFNNTDNVLTEKLREQGIQNVRLRDIREIPTIKVNQDAFSDQIPVYFRIDILKPIIIVHSIENEKKDAAIFTDMEVGDLRPNQDRMRKDELFKPSAMKKLSKWGLLFNQTMTKKGRTENQFMQLVNNPFTIEALKNAIINANLLRAQTALNYKHPESGEILSKYYVPQLSRTVYATILNDAYAYYEKTSAGKSIKVRPDIVNEGSENDPWIDYIPEKHGYSIFGNLHHPHSTTPSVFHNKKQLPRRTASNLDFDGIWKKTDRWIHVRGGGDHRCNWFDLTHQPPADGSGNYRVEFWK